VLDRPDRLNAQTPFTWAALREAGRSPPADVRPVVRRGPRLRPGPGGVRAGRDPGAPGLPELAAMPGAEGDATTAGSGGVQLAAPARPDLGRGRAAAIGAGFQLALACDLRVLADDATFTMAESRYGLVPGLGGTHPLVAAVGYAGRWRSADRTPGRRGRALAIGLATIVVPRARWTRSPTWSPRCIAAARRSPRPALLLGALGRDRDEQEAAERAAQPAASAPSPPGHPPPPSPPDGFAGAEGRSRRHPARHPAEVPR
jgi:enoyl-CoA hydratase/carnithine racemase